MIIEVICNVGTERLKTLQPQKYKLNQFVHISLYSLIKGHCKNICWTQKHYLLINILTLNTDSLNSVSQSVLRGPKAIRDQFPGEPVGTFL
jgi:hypothetical protein